jgi:hypothetical protein
MSRAEMLLVPLSTLVVLAQITLVLQMQKLFIYLFIFSKIKICEGKFEKSFGIFENVLFSKLNVQN